MKTKLLFLLLCASISLNGIAQAIVFTSVPVSTAVGTDLVVTYKYTALEAGVVKFAVTKNGGVNPWDYISQVAYKQTNVTAGTDVTGTFTVAIPAATVPKANLTGNDNYRLRLELFKTGNVWVKGDYSIEGYNFTSTGVVPAISITSIPTSTQVGTNLVVDYKYTIAADGKIAIAITKNGLVNEWDYISTVGFLELNPAVAGTDVTGTFTVPIPSGTTPTMALTGIQNYRIKIELLKADGGFLAGKYDNINYDFTAAPLGINNNKLLDAVTVYPNPVVSILNVKNTNTLSKASYSIINVLGKTVLKSEGLNEAVDVSNLSSGFYILSLKSDEGVKNFKFQKK
jgi:Secretion system C-terminal sorting domain